MRQPCAGARGETRQVYHHNPSTFFIGRRYAAHARAAANAAAWGLIPGFPALASPGFPALASPGAAHRGVGWAAGGGGEARGGRSLLGDVQGMCMSAGTFFQTVGGQHQQAHVRIHSGLCIGSRRPRLPRCGDVLQQRCHCLRGTRQVRGGARNARQISRYQDPHPRWRQPPGRRHELRKPWPGLDDMGKPEEALVHLQKGLEIMLKLLGSEHLSVADSFYNVGNVYSTLGQHERAFEYYQKSLDIKSRVVGAPGVTPSYQNVGSAPPPGEQSCSNRDVL